MPSQARREQQAGDVACCPRGWCVDSERGATDRWRSGRVGEVAIDDRRVPFGECGAKRWFSRVVSVGGRTARPPFHARLGVGLLGL